MNNVTNRYASIGKRLIALIIDGVILSVVSWLFFDKNYSFTGPGLSMGFIPMIIAWLYFSLQESSAKQATFGKRVMDIHIVGKDGSKIDFKQSSIRFFSKLLSSFLLLFGYIMAFFNDERRTLHDRLADTLVVDDQ